MSDSPAPSSDASIPDGNKPNSAPGHTNGADTYAFQASAGNNPYLTSSSNAFFCPHAYMVQNPYALPYVSQSPFYGQPFDPMAINGVYPQMAFTGSVPVVQPAPQAQQSSVGSSAQPDSQPISQVTSKAAWQGVSKSDIQPVQWPVSQESAQAMQNPESFPQSAEPIQSVQEFRKLDQNSIPQVQPRQTVQSTQSQSPSQATAQFSQPPAQATAQVSQLQAIPFSQTSEQLSKPMPPAQESAQASGQPSEPMAPLQVQKPLPVAASPSPVSSMPLSAQRSVSTVRPFNPAPLNAQQSSVFPYEGRCDFDPNFATSRRVTGAIILGVLSILFSALPPLGLLFSLIGLHLANTYIDSGGGRVVGNLARIFNIVGLILTIVIIMAAVWYIGYLAGQNGFLLFGEDPVSIINNSKPAQLLFDVWNKLNELLPL